MAEKMAEKKAKKKAAKKRYVLGGGLKLHDARRILGINIIAHTGRVNSHARCVGTKVKKAAPTSRAAAQTAFTKAATGGCKE